MVTSVVDPSDGGGGSSWLSGPSGPGGGGGGSGPVGRPSYLDPTVNETGTLQILLGEGPIAGLYEGLKSVYLDGTPVLSGDGVTKNFKGFAMALVAGTNTQPAIKGIAGSESETVVGVQVFQATPVVRSTSTNPSAVRVRISMPNQFKVIDSSNGNTSGNTVQIKIEIQNPGYMGGAWTAVVLEGNGVITGGPFSTKFTKTYHVDLPVPTGTWQIRVTRLSPDSTAYNLRDTWWEAFTEIIDVRLRYPNSAVLSMRVNSKQFKSIPQVTVVAKLLKIKVPANYTPREPFRPNKVAVDGTAHTFTRDVGSFIDDGFVVGQQITTTGFTNAANNSTFTISNVSDLVLTTTGGSPVTEASAPGRTITRLANYATTGPGTTAGAWDGSFKMAWCNNPAWVWYDMATSTRYGSGTFLQATNLDKWSLYNIGQWCDTLVDDGKMGLEPRMSANIYIQGQQNAIKALSDMASIFWGVTYYASGLVTAVADTDDVVSAVFTNANVEGGAFRYEGTAKQARHTVAIATFLNPELGYDSDVAVYEDQDGISRYGYNVLNLSAIGCTSHGQALRLCKWAILTELLASELVSFSSGLEGSVVYPGDIISISDQFRAGHARIGGRIISASDASNVTLDAPVTLAPGTSYTLSCQTLVGLETKPVSTPASTTSTLSVSSPFSSAPAAGTSWLLSTPTTDSLWRVTDVTKDTGLTYTVSALRHDPAKYAMLGLIAGDTIPRKDTSTAIAVPANLSIIATTRTLQDRNVQVLMASWDQDSASSYHAQASRDFGPWTDMVVTGPTALLDDVQPGTYSVRVCGVYKSGNSEWASGSYTVVASSTQPDWIKSALDGLASIASDNILSSGEKSAVVLDYTNITNEQAGIDAQADAYGVSRTSYDVAVSVLTTYLGTLPGWNVIPGSDVPIVGTTFRQKFADVYSNRQSLLNAIYAKAKALADAANDLAGSPIKPILFKDFSGGLPAGVTFPGTVASSDNGTTTTITNTVADQNLRFTGLNLDPTKSYAIAMRVKLITGPWEGVIYPSNAGHGENSGYRKVIPAPTVGVWTTIVADMRTLTVGGSDYMTGGNVLALRFDFINDLGTSVAIDWISVGAFGTVSQSDVDAAQSGVNTINDPDTLTTGEKPQIILDYNAITGENADLVAKANAYSVSHSTYDTAYSALMSYLSTLTSPTAWNSLSGTTSLGTGNRVALWNPKWTAVKNAAADLRNAIAVGTAQNAISMAATDATNKANAVQLASQPHQVAWAYASKPALPNASYPAGYYAITTDARTVQVNAAGTAWTDVLVAATGLFGQLISSQLTVTNLDNLIPNGTSDQTPPTGGWPAGSFEAAWLDHSGPNAFSGDYARAVYHTNGTYSGTDLAHIPCAAGDKYYMECMAKSQGPGMQAMGCYFRDAANNTVGWGSPTVVSSTSYAKASCIGTAPAGAVLMVIYLEVNDAQPSGWYWFDNLYARRMADASMIVDGTLQALVARVPLLYSLDMRSGSDENGYHAGTAISAPIGFRISAGGFPSTLLGGETFTAQMELGYGVNLAGYKLSGLTARAMSAIGDNGQAGTSFRCFYRGSNDPGTNGGRPNISQLTVTPRLYQVASPYMGRIDLKLAPNSYTDNLDGLSYAKIELFSQSAAGTTATLTARGVYYCPLGDRIYYNPTSDSDAGNASYATQVIAEAILSGVPACKVTLYGAAGSSDTHCFYSASGWTVGTALTDNGTSWPSGITGASGGGTGGGTGGGGNCPAPDVPLLMADGTEKPSGVVRVGDRVVAWDESEGCVCVEEVTHASMSTNHRWLLVLSNGRTGRFAANHRFLLGDGRWQELQHLVHGDVLTNGLVVESARADVYGPVVKITVNRVHTYTTLGVVSHNVKPQ